MKEDLKKLHESKNYDEIYNLIETKFSQFESRWNSVLASEEGVKLYRNTKLSPNNRDKIYRKMFVELIVQECMRMCDVASVGYDTHGHIKEANGCVSAKEYIAEHFGVEE